MIVGWIKLVAGLIILIAGGEWLVRSSVRLALFFKVSSMVIGLTIVSMGTSFPELVVSVNAALDGHPDIALGNVVGSNIANLALVMGLSALLLPMAIQRSSVIIDWPVMLVATIVMILFSLDLRISTLEGAILVCALVAYNLFTIKAARNASGDVDSEIDPLVDELAEKRFTSADMLRVSILLVGGLVALVFGADLLVDGAVSVARSFGIEERVIGLTIVAFGTSAPELATSLIAVYRRETSIGIGNLIGSNIFNILGILGITAIVSPINVNEEILGFDYYWVIGVPLLLFPFLISRMKITRLEGTILFGSYLVYIFLLF